MIKFQKRYFIETLENYETNSGHKHNAHMYSSRFQKDLYDESALTVVSRFSQNPSTNAMKTAHNTQHNMKTFLFNIKVLILSRENRHPILITHTSQSLTDHPF